VFAAIVGWAVYRTTRERGREFAELNAALPDLITDGIEDAGYTSTRGNPMRCVNVLLTLAFLFPCVGQVAMAQEWGIRIDQQQGRGMCDE
jgi:hypothetical protein